MFNTTTHNNNTKTHTKSKPINPDHQEDVVYANKNVSVQQQQPPTREQQLSLVILELARTYMDIEFKVSTPIPSSKNTQEKPEGGTLYHHTFILRDNRYLPENFFLEFLKELMIVGEFSPEVAIMALIYVKQFISNTGIRGRINYQKLIAVAFFLA